ncbi:hypothetical protein AYL99_04726 [Fonsecaea erecta]|uniref:Uncharacterized protein n=1 Tax=Fonsecaea erecta TaxID=1367422 RepID=A0A178ZSX1_9EURO|nr:hypothetical protein AYL99_04726 [Fonsecaea erecta]OAP62521.1 hypothetical protein AYL99_04726 [Fonsecaea erecta]
MPPTKISRVSRGGGIMKTTLSKSRPSIHGKSPLPNPAQKNESLGTQDFENESERSHRSAKKSSTSSTPGKKKGGDAEETRRRHHRSKPPASFLVKLERSQTQRMIVLGRKRSLRAGAPSEDIDIVGSTGNVYTVTISHLPTCTCPDSLRGNECKHKVYVLHTVLKAPQHLQFQLALLTSELEEIFAHAPPIPTDLSETPKGIRKATDGECPICYMELDEEHNELVWCKVQCGHNIHKSCFSEWARSQAGKGLRCVYCRTPWEMDVLDIEAIKRTGNHSEDGYVNVATHFGMSRERDHSSYYQPWARHRFGQRRW